MVRKCAGCEEVIVECMGFVKAGDIVEGSYPPRELCGRCALKLQWTPDGQLEPQVNPFLGAYSE